jgi:hypothetical protein
MTPKRRTTWLFPQPADLKAARKRLPSFKPLDLRTLVGEAGAGGDQAFLLAFRRHTQNQAIKLLTQIGIDPSQQNAWQRGFFWLACCYCGVGHLAWYEQVIRGAPQRGRPIKN